MTDFTNSSKLPAYDFVIHLTNRCNLSCEYCFMKGYHKDASYFENMSWDTFKHAIDAISRLDTSRGKAVLFTGGEPLLRDPEFISKCAKYAYETLGGRGIALGLQSNFTRMTDELLDMFKYYGFSMSSSFDTFDRITDRRHFTDEQRENILHHLSRLNVELGTTGFIMVLHEDNIDDFVKNWDMLDTYGLTQRFACLRCVENGQFEYRDMKGFSKKVIDIVYKHSLKHGKIERLFEEDCGFMVEKSTAREHHLCSCGDCTLNSMSIYPDGSVATCFYDKSHPNWHYANVNDLGPEDDILEVRNNDKYKALRKELHEITIRNCSACPIYQTCEGPCWETQGTLDTGIVNKSHCNIRKYGILYTYNFLMKMTEDEMFEYTPKLFYILNLDAYDLDGLKAKLESNFKETYLKLCKELDFDENIYE